MEKMLPCPFCGAKANTYQAEPMHSVQDEGWYCRCSDCGAEIGFECNRKGGMFGIFASEAEAIEAWNKRYVHVHPADMLNHYAW